MKECSRFWHNSIVLATMASVLMLTPVCLSGARAAESGLASSAFTHVVTYTADVIGPVHGGASQAGRFLDNLDLIGDLDLELAKGWTGAKAHIHILNNSGGMPNALAGTLQGVDNIEVSRALLRLFEFWIEKNFPGSNLNVRAGLYDLNSEFYSNDNAGLLI